MKSANETIDINIWRHQYMVSNKDNGVVFLNDTYDENQYWLPFETVFIAKKFVPEEVVVSKRKIAKKRKWQPIPVNKKEKWFSRADATYPLPMIEIMEITTASFYIPCTTEYILEYKKSDFIRNGQKSHSDWLLYVQNILAHIRKNATDLFSIYYHSEHIRISTMSENDAMKLSLIFDIVIKERKN